jgi:hypothetical protein
MDYKAVLLEDLGKGFSKSDLERLIRLPKNSLSGVLSGTKKLSKKSELKIEVWEKSDKPNPLEVKYWNRVEDLVKGNFTDIDTLDNRVKIEFTKPMHVKAQAAMYNATHTDSQMQVKDVKISELKDYVGIPEEAIVELAENSKKYVVERISQIEDLLKAPPKYLPHSKRVVLEKELFELKNR